MKDVACAQSGARRPLANEMIARMSATTKMIFAMPAADAAIPKNPKKAAISAMMKKVIAQENIGDSFTR